MSNDSIKRKLSEEWSYERDFSNWLKDNIKIVGDVIGKEFISAETEVKNSEKNGNGKYPADILAVTNKNEKVIIENQYHITDHRHLGQLLTYATWLDSTTIVWIAESVTKEHFNAMKHIDENHGFECWLLIAQLTPKHELQLRVAEEKDCISISENEITFLPQNANLNILFWEEFEKNWKNTKELLLKKNNWKIAKTKRTDCITISFGKSYKMNVPFRKENIKIELQFKDKGGVFYKEIKKQKDTIKDELDLGKNDKFDLVEPSVKTGCSQIRIEKLAKVANEEKWDVYIEWMIKNIVKLQAIADRLELNVY